MPSQIKIILQYLRRRPGRWVPMPQLMRVSGSSVVHSRIAELRRRRLGKVENRLTYECDGERCIVHSCYRLVPERRLA